MNKGVKPAMAHNVYFWVKEGTSEQEILGFEKGLKKLGTVPTLLHYWGKPAPTEKRNVTDHSYHYSINALFASLALLLGQTGPHREKKRNRPQLSLFDQCFICVSRRSQYLPGRPSGETFGELSRAVHGESLAWWIIQGVSLNV